MSAAIDRLAVAKARPAVVEHAVRRAVRDAIAWRIGGGNPPRRDALLAAAVAAARATLDARSADSGERSLTLAAVERAISRFAQSPLGKRLLAVPASRLMRVTSRDAADAVVRDRHGHPHLIAIRHASEAFAAARLATTIARDAAPAIWGALTPITVHVYSLANGRHYTFTREIDARRTAVA